MTEYVIPIGNSGLETWWQVAVVASFAIMYIIANVIPAATLLFGSIAKKDFTLEIPLFVFLLLVPFIGSLMGLMSYEENERVNRTFLILLYVVIISGFVCIVDMYC